MNKIKEMIERLCPDGVEYKTLDEIAKIVLRENELRSKIDAIVADLEV